MMKLNRSKAVVVREEIVAPRVRQRPLVAPVGFLTFQRKDMERPEVYIHENVFQDVADTAEASLPNEWIGLLYGRVWRDPIGDWIIVSHCVSAQAGEAEASPVYCALTPEGSLALRQRAANLHPSEESIGWAHSHVGEQPSFSAQDFRQQEQKAVDAVGLLAYRSSGRWAFTVYLGPQAAELAGSALVISPDSLEETGLGRPVTTNPPSLDTSPQQAAVVVQPPKEVTPRATARAETTLLNRLLKRLPRVRLLPIACVPDKGYAPLRVHCLKAIEGDDVTWEFGDGTVSRQKRPQHTFSRPGTYLVKLYIRTDRGIRVQAASIVVLPKEV